MKILKFLLVIMLAVSTAEAQMFINLGFEQADVPVVPANPSPPVDVPVERALPGWTAIRGGVVIQEIDVNGSSIGGSLISLKGPTLLVPFGNYELNLIAGGTSSPPTDTSVAIMQLGEVPFDSAQLSFYTLSDLALLRLELAGTEIPLIDIGDRVVGNVSAFAGQVVELKITGFSRLTEFGEFAVRHRIDDLQFSNVPVPEPDVAILCCAAGVIGMFRRRRGSAPWAQALRFANGKIVQNPA